MQSRAQAQSASCSLLEQKRFPQSLKQSWSISSSPNLLRPVNKSFWPFLMLLKSVGEEQAVKENEKIKSSQGQEMAGPPPRAASPSLLWPCHMLWLQTLTLAPSERKLYSQALWPRYLELHSPRGLLNVGGLSAFPGLQKFAVQVKGNHVTYFNHSFVCYKIELLTPPFQGCCEEQMVRSSTYGQARQTKIVIAVIVNIMIMDLITSIKEDSWRSGRT